MFFEAVRSVANFNAAATLSFSVCDNSLKEPATPLSSSSSGSPTTFASVLVTFSE